MSRLAGSYPVLAHTGIAVFSLVLVSLAFHPLDAWPLAWVAFVPWMAWHETGPRRGTGRALMAAYFVHFAAVLWWVAEVSLPLALAIPLLGMPFVYVLAWIVDRLVHRRSVPGVLAYPLAVVSVEVVRDQVLELSWSSVGYTQWRWLEGLQSAAVFRVHALSFAVLLVNAALARALVHLWRRRGASRTPAPSGRSVVGALGAAAAVALALHVWGAVRVGRATFEEGPLAVGIQANIPQHRKERRQYSLSWFTHTEVWNAGGGPDLDPDLMVFAETSLHPIKDDVLPVKSLLEALLVNRPSGPMLWGDLLPRGRGQLTVLGYHKGERIPEGSSVWDEDGDGYQEWNVAGVVKDGILPVEGGEYRKRKVVPFGETIPLPPGFPFRDALKNAVFSAAGYTPDLSAGTEFVPITLETRGHSWRFATSICYEVVFPREIRELTRTGVDFMVNISNDGWYRESSELDLVHVAARFRAVECGRSLFRVSNTGISTSIDPLGRYRETVSRDGRRKSVSGLLVDRIPIAGGETPFVRWGDLPLAGFVAALALVAVLGPRRARQVP